MADNKNSIFEFMDESPFGDWESRTSGNDAKEEELPNQISAFCKVYRTIPISYIKDIKGSFISSMANINGVSTRLISLEGLEYPNKKGVSDSILLKT